MIDRRSLITGLVSLVAAPSIVRVDSLMPVKSGLCPNGWHYDGLIHPAACGSYESTLMGDILRVLDAAKANGCSVVIGNVRPTNNSNIERTSALNALIRERYQ